MKLMEKVRRGVFKPNPIAIMASTLRADSCRQVNARSCPKDAPKIRYRFYPPKAYQPPVFGQSLSNVRGAGKGDAWCAFWSTWFVLSSLRRHPQAFIEMIQRIPVNERAERTILVLRETVKELKECGDS